VWVCVVTGSGSHSESGPVIRTAVANLLKKRGMNFHANRGGGSFTVDAASGIELQDDPRTRYVDTKVILQHRSCSSPNLVNPALRGGRGAAAAGGVPRRASDSSTVMAVNGDGRCASSSTVMAVNGDGVAAPRPAEVAADDALLRRAQSASAATASREHSRRQRQEREMHRAVLESNELRERDEEGRRELERALARSVEDTGGRVDDNGTVDDEDVERAIRESVALAAEREAMARAAADDAVQRAIQESMELAQWQRQEREVAGMAGDCDAEEEIQRAIRESLAFAPLLRHEDEASSSGGNSNENEAIDRAILESLASAASEKFERVTSHGTEEAEVERRLRESLTLTVNDGFTSTEDEDGRYRDRRGRAKIEEDEEERRLMEEVLQQSLVEAGVETDDDGGDIVLYTARMSANAVVAAPRGF